MAKAPQQNQQQPATQSKDVVNAPPKGKLLVDVFSQRYGIQSDMMLSTLRGTAFKVKASEPQATNEELAALLAVAYEYHLNPFIREIYCYRAKSGALVPIVGFDGWIRLVQRQPNFDGEEFTSGYDESPDKHGAARGFFYECKMFRTDRGRPTIVREYHNENWRDTDPWNQMPNRMTRMRSYIQCARVCFGFGGIYDEDEGERIRDAMAIEGTATVIQNVKPTTVAPRAKIAHTLAETARANFVETAQAQPSNSPPAEAMADAEGAFQSLASEDLTPSDEDEAGARG